MALILVAESSKCGGQGPRRYGKSGNVAVTDDVENVIDFQINKQLRISDSDSAFALSNDSNMSHLMTRERAEQKCMD